MFVIEQEEEEITTHHASSSLGRNLSYCSLFTINTNNVTIYSLIAFTKRSAV